MSRGRGLVPGLALLAAALVCAPLGCGSVPALGPVERPEIYPDRTEHDAALATFLWAWHTGDIDALDQVLGAWLHHDLELQLEKNGRDAVSEFYRRGAERLTLLELDWEHVGDALAYARIVISAASLERAELDISLLRRPDGWVVSGKRRRR